MDAFLFAYVDKKLVYKGPDRVDYLAHRSLPDYPVGTVFHERHFIDRGDRLSFSGQDVRKDSKLAFYVLTSTVEHLEIEKTDIGEIPQEERTELVSLGWLKDSVSA